MHVEVHRAAAAAMRAHAETARPNEACGLLATANDDPVLHGLADLLDLRPGLRVVRYFPLSNTQPSPHRFTMDPVEFARTENEIRAANQRLCGFFHSHPLGEAVPSRADRAAAWPSMLQLILGRDGDLSGWFPIEGVLHPVPIRAPVPARAGGTA